MGALIDTNNLLIDDTPGISLAHVMAESRRIKRERGKVGMILVDYLTLMTADKAERNDLAYGLITKGLKTLAKELDCVVVLLTQLNRELEKRTNKRPLPSDSRDTGQIEQDCDYWLPYTGRAPTTRTQTRVTQSSSCALTGMVRLVLSIASSVTGRFMTAIRKLPVSAGARKRKNQPSGVDSDEKELGQTSRT
ncbi:DnaB domain-containing protein [Klebsiella aerogenes]|nr:DnaB domain-containing protein [Klebsiella aerogenes]